MINLLTLFSDVKQLQNDVVFPLYGDHSNQTSTHEELLYQTGKAIERHKLFIEEVFNSTFIKVALKIIRALGFADKLTDDDFDHFRKYVNDGGLNAMLNMLKATDMKEAFTLELSILPPDIQRNAPHMLKRAKILHADYMDQYFRKKYIHFSDMPSTHQFRFRETELFFDRLIELAEHNVEVLNSAHQGSS